MKGTGRALMVGLLMVLLTGIGSRTHAQTEVPIGEWRWHVSYAGIKNITLGSGVLYGAADNGVMTFDVQSGSIQTFNKLDGLSGAGISGLAWDAERNQLLLVYADGNIDIIKDNSVTNFNRLKTSTTIIGSKQLNDIIIRGNLAYIAADFGLVVFDLIMLEVKETWRDLGTSGEEISIIESTFSGDSIFLATEQGVLAGDLDDNLLDFNNWKRFNQGEFNSAIQSVTTFNEKVYAAINASGIHHYENGSWIKESYLQGITFQSMASSSNHLYIMEGSNLWQINSSNTLTPITDAVIEQPYDVVEDSEGKLWVGDGLNGLVSNGTGTFKAYVPNGPSTSITMRLNVSENKMIANAGGPSSSYQPLRNPGEVNIFSAGSWSTQSSSMKDIVETVIVGQATYRASFGYGLEVIDVGGASMIWDESNSPLKNLNPPQRFVNISAIEPSDAGLWVANYGTSTSLHLLKNDNTWESFSFPVLASRYPTHLAVDFYGYVWMVLNPAQGGGVLIFDRAKNRYAYVTETPGSGGLPSKNVRSIAVDRDGYVWVGTDVGVAYFIDPPDVFAPGLNAVKPIYENRFLLKDDKVTAITIDGGNRKWMGTERGAWLFSPDGEDLIYNFTEENSPLISNVIRDGNINPVSGEVFFATDKGVVSYRAEATASTPSFQSIKIFPNPVTSNFSGTIGISGLATDATVKITDVAGNLIWQTQANGGTATWNGQDYNGRKAKTGIYLVFAATADGGESVVGKIAVIE